MRGQDKQRKGVRVGGLIWDANPPLGLFSLCKGNW